METLDQDLAGPPIGLVSAGPPMELVPFGQSTEEPGAGLGLTIGGAAAIDWGPGKTGATTVVPANKVSWGLANCGAVGMDRGDFGPRAG